MKSVAGLLFCLSAFSLPAAILNVPAGANLQAFLNAARPGDTVVLAAGATYIGNFYLPNNPGPDPITIQSSAMASLPAPGIRVSPADAPNMPKLVTPNANPALSLSTGNNHFRITGIEFYPAAGVYVQDLIASGKAYETSLAALPSDIRFERDYIHGEPTQGGKRGIALNSASTDVRDSYVSGFFSTWQDTQAICGWNGPGPFNIVNNYLEAGTETVAFGGAVPSISGVLPSDILIQNNTFWRPQSWIPDRPGWDGIRRWVKNHLELKTGRRVTIDSNEFDYNWKGADQRGFMLVFTVRTEVNQVPWAVINDVKITNNHFRHAAAGVNITLHDDNPPGSGLGSDYLFQNNVFEDISSSWGGDGRMFQMLGSLNVTIDHNTIFQDGYLFVFDYDKSTNLSFTNNIASVGQGIAANGAGVGASAWNGYTLGNSPITNNLIIGADPYRYPANNFYNASSFDDVQMMDWTNEQYDLVANSPFSHAGTDGKAIGAYFNPPLMLSNTDRAYLSPANTGSLGIMTLGNVNWSVTADQPWITLNNTTAGSGYGSVGYSLSPNTTGSARSAVLTVRSTLGTQTLTVNQSATAAPPSQPLQFIPLATPCRAADTRSVIGPIAANTSRDFAIASACNIPSTAQAFSLNTTVVPLGSLNYLTVWPTGNAQPFVSTLNSRDGRIKANASITPAGTNGSVSVFATDRTQVILDVTGYFVPVNTPGALAYYPLTPCRVMDSRDPDGPLGGPYLIAGMSRVIPVQTSTCQVPASAQAYSLNVTALPHASLLYITVWPSGQSQPATSTLNSPTAAIEANAAILPAGINGDLQVYSSSDADLVVDINGYFAPPGDPGALNFYTTPPCRAVDPRYDGDFHPHQGTAAINLYNSGCSVPDSAGAFVVNATAVPQQTLSYLTLWAAGNGPMPLQSTLNAYDGQVTSNLAIVPAASGSINAYATDSSYIILDLMGYFAP